MARLGRVGPLFAFCSVGGERARRGARGGKAEARPAGTMSYIPGQPVTAVVQRVEIHKLRQGENLILGFSIGGGIDQDPTQNPFSEDKTDKGIYVTRVTEGGPAEVAGLQVGDKIMQVNGWDMTMVTHDQARKRLTKRNEEVVRLLVTRHSLQKAVRESMMS
ncbi:tax1-binding protein 3 [Zootoca vivipara]|uniref:tax1-binding protein 3 n=1 Tax=Zootoca vivipara TaxID=8524 RepID=UPI00293BA8B3|nr:tax1-binding protein 3 [Zootoca vivipara]